MTLIQASSWIDEPEDWLIDGLVGPSLTILSGEPKMGKSLLAGYLVNSLITQTPILDRKPRVGKFKIAWLGYDSDWANELMERFPEITPSLYFQRESLTYDNQLGWNELYKGLIANEINFVVVDHLYGVSAELDLDESHLMNKAVVPLRHIVDVLKIPVLLLAHAGKNGNGRALHSVGLEAQGRSLIRITGSVRSQTKQLVLVGNRQISTSLKISLTTEELTLKSESDAKAGENRISQRNGEMLTTAQRLIQNAPESARENASAAGRWLASQGVSKTDEGGRSLVNKLMKGGLLARSQEDLISIVPGPKLGT